MTAYFVSHFSGIGGAAIGAKSSGYKIAGAIEISHEIAELYRSNIGDVVVRDIAEVDPGIFDVPSHRARRSQGDILVIQTSPPCQDYSRANIGKQNTTSARANILAATFSHYRVLRPEYVILENVPDYRRSPVYLEFENFLVGMRYSVLRLTVPAASFGVPQYRERFYAIAWAKGMPQPNIRITHQKDEWVGWGSVLEDLIPTFERSELTGNQGVAVVCAGADRGKWLIERIRYRGSPEIRHSSELSPALTASMGDDFKGGTRNKVLDIWDADTREAFNVSGRGLARLQTFPDWYELSGNMRVDCKGLGNAVACKVMKSFLQQISESF